MAKKSKQGPPADKLALYEKLIKTNPALERKGATTAYTAYNGNMFTYLSNAGEFGLRLPEGEREAFLKKFKTTLLKQYGAVMKEYVHVPDALLKKTRVLKKYLAISFAYVKTLKKK